MMHPRKTIRESPGMAIPGKLQAQGQPSLGFRTLALVCLTLVGCVHSPPTDVKSSVKSSPVPRAKTSGVAKVGVDGYLLGEGEQPPASAELFWKFFQERCAMNNEALLVSVICRYPEAALETLKRSRSAQAKDARLLKLAQLVDRRLGDKAANWSELVADKARTPAKYQAYETLREITLKLHSAQQHDKVDLAGWQKLTPSLPPILQAEALRLQAITHLACLRHEPAAAALERAVELASGSPLEAAHLRLLLGDVCHRCEKHERAVALWSQAILAASRYVIGQDPVLDPAFWERAIVGHPYGIHWPAATKDALAAILRENFLGGTKWNLSAPTKDGYQHGEEAVWLWVGHARLVRKEGKSALVAFKRAESLANNEELVDRLRICQAQAFALMGQSVAALPLLVAIIQKRQDLAPTALAALGSIKVSEGMIEPGAKLLANALQLGKDRAWQGRAEAEADFGLALLVQGRESEGLASLHRAQARFEQAGQHEEWTQALLNESAYLENIGQAGKAQDVQGRIASQR